MEIDLEKLDLLEVILYNNYISSKHYSFNEMKQGLMNSKMTPEEMRKWGDAYEKAARKRSGECELKIKKVEENDEDWWAQAKQKCEEECIECSSISFEDFCNYKSLITVEEYIMMKKKGRDINDLIKIKRMSKLYISINDFDFISEGLNVNDFKLLKQRMEKLNEDEASLINKTKITINNDEKHYSFDDDINSLPKLVTKYRNFNINIKRHKFTQDEKFVIFIWMMNNNFRNKYGNELNMCTEISKSVFLYDDNNKEIDKEERISSNEIRDQWTNYIKPISFKLDWKEEDTNLLLEKYQQFGPRWDYMKTFFTDKSANNIRNKFYFCIKQKSSKNELDTSINLELLQNILTIKEIINSRSSYKEICEILLKYVGKFNDEDAYNPKGFDFAEKIFDTSEDISFENI